MDFNRIDTTKRVDAAFKCVTIIGNKLGNDQIAMSLAEVLKERTQIVQDSLGPKNEKNLTQDLNEADAKRDDIYRSIWHLIQSNLCYNELGESAKDLKALEKDICDDGISFLTGSYKTESTLLNTKVELLKSPKYEQIVNVLGLKTKIEALVEAQIKFNEIYENRRVEKENRPTPVGETMPAFVKSVYALKTYILSTYDNEMYKSCFEPFETAMDPKGEESK
jgi:Family of unknown function (DUF6261)